MTIDTIVGTLMILAGIVMTWYFAKNPTYKEENPSATFLQLWGDIKGYISSVGMIFLGIYIMWYEIISYAIERSSN